MSSEIELRPDQLAPYSMEAEEAVCGSVLVNPEAIDEVHWLESDYFFIQRHSWIWEAMKRLKQRGDPLDYLTVVNELEQTGKLAETGGAAYILSLINKTPSALNVEGYGRIVERMFVRRDLLSAASDIARWAHSDETEIDEVLRLCDNRVGDVMVRHVNKQDVFVPVRDAAGDLWEQAVRWRADPGKYRGMCCGLDMVDWLSRGFRKNKLYYIAARPNMGKSAMLGRLARGFAAQGLKVMFYALEMSAFDMVARMACQITNIVWDKVEDGTLTQAEHERFLDGVLQVSELGIVFNETAGLTMQEYWDKTTAYEKEHGPVDVVIIDTINCVRGIGDSDTARMTNSSRVAKTWAHSDRHHYAIICAVQMNRALEAQADKRPALRALRDSGALEEDGDNIWGIYREGYYNKEVADNTMLIEVLKERQNGQPAGSTITLGWNGGCFGIEKRDGSPGAPPPAPFVQATFASESTRHMDR